MRNRSENQITLIMLRHGATQANKERRYLGKTNEALSHEGESELKKYKELQLYSAIDVLFSSPMKRCIQTAEILYPKMQPVLIKEWEEMDFGAFEGKNYKDLQGDERYQAWIDSNGTLPFPGGESREDFIVRCDEGFRRMIEHVRENRECRTAGMIVHGGTIMALLSRYCGGEYFDYQAANGKGYICTVENLYDEKIKITGIKATI